MKNIRVVGDFLPDDLQLNEKEINQEGVADAPVQVVQEEEAVDFDEVFSKGSDLIKSNNEVESESLDEAKESKSESDVESKVEVESKPESKQKRKTTSKEKATNYYTGANVKNRNKQKRIPKEIAKKPGSDRLGKKMKRK